VKSDLPCRIHVTQLYFCMTLHSDTLSWFLSNQSLLLLLLKHMRRVVDKCTHICAIICPVIGIIHVHCRKMYNSFIRAKETGRKAILWQTFLHCFASSANEFIFFDSVYILYLPYNVKIPKEMAISLKIAETHHWNIWDLLFLTRSEQTNTFLSGSFSVQSLN